MRLCDVFVELGEENFRRLLGSVSIGKLKSYQLFDRVKARAHLNKLNAQALQRAAPRLWARMQEGDDEFATDIAQAALVSHMDMIAAILDFLGIPHQDGFFSKETDASRYLTDGWQQRVYDRFHTSYPKPALVLYINHLAWETGKADQVFHPAS